MKLRERKGIRMYSECVDEDDGFGEEVRGHVSAHYKLPDEPVLSGEPIEVRRLCPSDRSRFCRFQVSACQQPVSIARLSTATGVSGDRRNTYVTPNIGVNYIPTSVDDLYRVIDPANHEAETI